MDQKPLIAEAVPMAAGWSGSERGNKDKEGQRS
jgi:hypothetical protein